MSNPNRRGQAGSPVSTGSTGATATPFANTHFILPYGLRLQQTINAGTTSVTIPAGITFVYAIAVGGGGGGSTTAGGGAGGVTWGWTLANSTCIVGTGGAQNTNGNYTRYGNIIAGFGSAGAGAPILGGGSANGVGATNYWGIPGGTNGISTSTFGKPGSGAGGGFQTATLNTTSGKGGDGISGGGGAYNFATGTGTLIAGAGGSGLVGGGGGGANGNTGTRTGGIGGNGINILTGGITTGGAASTGTSTNGAGGGGGGLAANGSDASGINGGNGGTGGGGGGAQGAGGTAGSGGNGILYLFY